MNKEEVWERVLVLWKKLSETPNKDIKNIHFSDYEESLQSNFKNSILEELGYNHCKSGCPFCEEYYINNNCNDCPISFGERLNCAYKTPYGDWSSIITTCYIHRQEFAKDFYEWLKEIHEKV